MSEQFPVLNYEKKNPDPLFEINVPRISKKSVLARLDIEIDEMAKSKKNTRAEEIRRDKLQEMFDAVGEINAESELMETSSNWLQGKVDENIEKGEILEASYYKEAQTYLRAQEALNTGRKDFLTSLYRREGLIEALDLVINKTDSVFGPDLMGYKGHKVTVIMTDIDNFGVFNKKHGHFVGDEILSGYADTLVGGIRQCDLVGRWGGEENVVIAFGDVDPHTIDARIFENVLKYNDKLRETRPELFKNDKGEVDKDMLAVTFSAGGIQVEWSLLENIFKGRVTLNEKGEVSKDNNGNIILGDERQLTMKEKERIFSAAVVDVADSEMQKAKKQGKNTIRVFDPNNEKTVML